MIDSDRIRKKITRTSRRKKQSVDLLGTGSTLLNLACSDSWKGSYPKGSYIFFVGDSESGKTFFCLTCMAEAATSSAFDDYRLIYDDVEGGALMDFERFFGPRLAKRIEPPAKDKDGPIYSQKIEDFYFNLDNALDRGPCVYLLDSMDALSSDYESKKFQEKKDAAQTGKTAKGDYGDGKAKINASHIRQSLSKIRKTGSILIVINQTRDNIGASMFEPQKTRSGGHALRFYATLELWSSCGSEIKRTIKGKPRVLGVTSRIRIKKNRVNGKRRSVEVPIYYSYGIDDIGSCIDYLISEGHWKKQRSGVIGPIEDFETDDSLEMKKGKLIRYIEENNLETELRCVVASVWKSVESACVEPRKPRYS